MLQFTVLNTQVTGGLRMEHTEQGYKLKQAKYGQTPDSSQSYYDFLPSVSLKYMPASHVNIGHHIIKLLRGLDSSKSFHIACRVIITS